MVPRSHKLSPLSRKMYNVFLYLSQVGLRNMQAMPSATHLFEAPLADVLRLCGAPKQNHGAKVYLAEMRKTDVVWDSPDSTAELQQVGFSLISESRISMRSQTTWVHWALPPFMYEALSDPERWASLDLLVMSRLNLYGAIVLYEICSKYRDNPTRVTCKKSPEWWMELLIATPTAIDPVSGKKKFPEWRKFKNKYLNPAIAQINEASDINIELLEDRGGGKSLKTAQFLVEIKRVKQLEDRVELPKINPDVVRYAKELGVDGAGELEAMSAQHGENQLMAALHRLEERLKQINLPLVKSPSGLLRHYMKPDSITATELIDKAPSPSEEKTQATFFTDPKRNHDEERITALREAYFKEILQLSFSDLSNLLSAYRRSLIEKNMLTPATERRLNPENWRTGAVKFGVIDFYALAKDGSAWRELGTSSKELPMQT